MAEPEVLIAGAGPTGLTLACDLARRGVSVRIIDASDAPFPGSRAKGLQPRSLEVLDDLGVSGRLVAAGRFRLRVRIHNGSSAGEKDLHAGAAPGPSAPYGTTLLVPQWRVEEVLLGRLAELGVEVVRSTRLVSWARTRKA